MRFIKITHLKFNSSPLKIGRNPKGEDRLPLPSFFRGELLNFGGVGSLDEDRNYVNNM